MILAVTNVMKVVDLDGSQLSKEFLAYLKTQQPTYSDNVLNEHLYPCPDGDEHYTDWNDQGEIQALKKVCDASGSSYFRIVLN